MSIRLPPPRPAAELPLLVVLLLDLGPDLVPVDLHLLHPLDVLRDLLLLVATIQMFQPKRKFGN